MYISKFLQIFIDLILSKFSTKIREKDLLEYKTSRDILKEFSRELWFYDDDPTTYDIYDSNNRKDVIKMNQKQFEYRENLYYKDPFERLHGKKNRFL